MFAVLKHSGSVLKRVENRKRKGVSLLVLTKLDLLFKNFPFSLFLF